MGSPVSDIRQLFPANGLQNHFRNIQQTSIITNWDHTFVISDIAICGGQPRQVITVLILPGDMEVKQKLLFRI